MCESSGMGFSLQTMSFLSCCELFIVRPAHLQTLRIAGLELRQRDPNSMNTLHPDTRVHHQIWAHGSPACLHWWSSGRMDARSAESRLQNELSDSLDGCVCKTGLPSRSSKSFSTDSRSSCERW